MTIARYIHSRGLRVQAVAEELGVSRQNIYIKQKEGCEPTMRTLKRIASAMTKLGKPTTVNDLINALYGTEKKKGKI